MSDPSSPGPPEQVRKRAGTVEPFEADKISRALFAAGESLGRPDAFLARELADVVVHFLSEESSGATITTQQIAEVVVKTVRELGHPALAEAFSRRPSRPPSPGAAAGQSTLHSVYSRDLVSLHNDGLLILTGLEAPCELAGFLLAPQPAEAGTASLLAAVRRARPQTGEQLVLDSPEHGLARSGASPASLALELETALRESGLQMVVNLNTAEPPPALGSLATGPLFGPSAGPRPEQLAGLADGLLTALLQADLPPGRLRLDWHLGEADFQPAGSDRLQSLIRLVFDAKPLTFVFDRPRRPVALAEGMDRQQPAVLARVGLHLPRLVELTGVQDDAERFLAKLGSLARLALSAGVQKRAFLRQQEDARPALNRGFLLAKAVLVAVPVGLDQVVRHFIGRGLCSGGQARSLGRSILIGLRDVLRQDGGRAYLPACLDGPCSFRLSPGQDLPSREQVAGLTPWAPEASAIQQMRAASSLHAIADRGTLALFLPRERQGEEPPITEVLHSLWRETSVARVRLLLNEPRSTLP
jgi:hypothetical protein